MQARSTWLAGVSVRPGGIIGLGKGERLDGDEVAAFTLSQFGERTPAVQRDWIRFLWETEDRYWQTMCTHLKNDLKVQALVIGTIVGCSTPNLMAKLDCIDTHAYWQHPVFPGRPWDAENWLVQNLSMVSARGGVLPELALRRVLGKPFCVTEYGNPAPNTYGSEGHILRAAYASLQDWDYISASRYSHSNTWDDRCVLNFFDINQHPTKMATLIPAAAIFLRGDVKAALQLVVARLGKEQEVDVLRHGHAWEMVHAGDAGVPREASLIHRVALATGDRPAPAFALTPDQAAVTGDRFDSDTGELAWDVREKARGVVTVNAEESKAVIGFGGGKRFDLAGVVIEPGPTRQAGWSAITVTAMEGDFGKPPCRMLVTATGSAENTKMGWKNAEKSTVGKDWGQAPTLVEGIPARITLPFSARSVEVWALNECGQRKGMLAVAAGAGGHAAITLGPEQQTIWYEAVAK